MLSITELLSSQLFSHLLYKVSFQICFLVVSESSGIGKAVSLNHLYQESKGILLYALPGPLAMSNNMTVFL